MLQIMSFKKSNIPNDAINSKEIDSIYKFLAHIDSSEPFVQGLITFHIVTLLTVIATRRKLWIQGLLFTIFRKYELCNNGY